MIPLKYGLFLESFQVSVYVFVQLCNDFIFTVIAHHTERRFCLFISIYLFKHNLTLMLSGTQSRPRAQEGKKN